MSAAPAGGGRRGGRRALLAGVLLFAVLLGVGTVPRLVQRRELAASVRDAEAAPLVQVVRVKRGPPSSELVLPGTVQALREASLHAQSSGFVRRFHADIGARVRRGQLLAEVATPEVDQQVAQARAALVRAQAARALTQASLRRWEAMARDSAATPQELDERRAADDAAAATVAAAQADVRRLEELQGFGRVVAPFAGVVTARNVEVGQLVSPSAGATPLFVLVQADTARVMINVPEGVAAQVRPGDSAQVRVRDAAGAPVVGRVARTAGALDPSTRTMLTEIQVPNAKGALLTGTYAEVRLAARRVDPGMVIPANALLVRSTGPQVAVVRDGRVHIARVELGRDFGTEIEVRSGLEDNAMAVINPSDQVVEGAAVRVAAVAEDK